MALEINRNPEQKDMPKPYISDRRLYLTADRTRIVEEGDADAAYVFVGAGSEVQATDAQRFGITMESGKVVLPKPEDAAESGEPSGTIKKPRPTDESDAARYWGAEKLKGVMFASGAAREKAKHAKLMTEDFEGKRPKTAMGFSESEVQEIVDAVGERTALDALKEEQGHVYAGVPGDGNGEGGDDEHGDAASLDDIKFATPAARKHAEDAGLTAADFKGKRKDKPGGFSAAKVDSIAESKKAGEGGEDKKDEG